MCMRELTWRNEMPAARRLESGEFWRTGELEVFLSGAGITPGGVAGTCSVEGGEPTCISGHAHSQSSMHSQLVCVFLQINSCKAVPHGRRVQVAQAVPWQCFRTTIAPALVEKARLHLGEWAGHVALGGEITALCLLAAALLCQSLRPHLHVSSLLSQGSVQISSNASIHASFF